MSNWQQSTLESPTGAHLNLYSAVIAGQPKAVVQINHGMGEHAARYQRFSDYLNQRGYHAYAHDHRGHGMTTASNASPARFADKDGWSKVVADVAAVNQHIHHRHSSIPVVCFGHSMGSIISFNYALHHANTIDAFACWNAGFTTGIRSAAGRMILKIERMFKGSDAPSAITEKLTFEAWNAEFKPNRTECDWLSRDEAEVDKYLSDPLCGVPNTIGMWLNVLDGVYFNADDNNPASLRNDLPVHLQAGTADPCSEHGKAIEAIAPRLRKAGLKDVTLNILPDARHESLNETNRDAIMKGFADWLDQRFAG